MNPGIFCYSRKFSAEAFEAPLDGFEHGFLHNASVVHDYASCQVPLDFISNHRLIRSTWIVWRNA